MSSTGAPAQVPLQGQVTDGTSGLPGVAVSDGRHVTRTGANGAWELPGHGPFVVVTVPSGWRARDWFRPAHDTDLTFVLQPAEPSLPLTFVHVTDLHVSLGDTDLAPDGSDAALFLGNDGQMHERVNTSPAIIRELWSDIARRVPDAAFVAATGDLTNTGSDAEYAAWTASVEAATIPVVSIPGNHDHHAQPGELPDDATSVDFHAVPARFESHLGPRWFSFEHSGLHVVAIDWFTHLLDIDREDQEAWLQADLASVDPNMPVVLLSHDQMPSSFFERLPRQPIATFSGHWHTSRVARVGDTLHVNTPTATFGGLDYSPASFRVASWDGEAISVRTVHRQVGPTTQPARPTATSIDASRATSLPGTGHRATPVIIGDLVLATSSDEDRPAGWLTAVDRSSGDVVWTVQLDSACKSPATTDGEVAVVTAVTGETVCVGLDGVERWRRHLDDPLRLWAYLRPVVHDGLVLVGDVGRFCCLDLTTGETVWERTDLGQRENLTSLADPVVVDETLVLAFAGQSPVLQGLNPRTGSTRWPANQPGRSIYRLPQGEVMQELPRTIMAPPVADGTDVIVIRLGSVVERLRASDGEVVWSAAHHGWFNPGRGTLVADLLVTPIGTGHLRAVDRTSGEVRWHTTVTTDAPVAAGAYRTSGGLSLGSLAPTATGVVVATGDGVMSHVDTDGRITWQHHLGSPALGGVASDGVDAWTVTLDGALHRVALR